MSDQKILEGLALQHGSDKHGSHFYMQHYAKFFFRFRDLPINLLEIGIGGYDNPDAGGASLKVWRDYFTAGSIYGLDYFDKSRLESPRIKTFRGSQADPVVIAKIIETVGTPGLDIIIDDGSHRSEHVITSFAMLFQHLNDGGIYVIEDVQTAYWPDLGGNFYNPDSSLTSIGYLKSLIDGLNWQERHLPTYTPNYTDSNIKGISFYHNLVFIEKGQNLEGSNKLTNCRLPDY